MTVASSFRFRALVVLLLSAFATLCGGGHTVRVEQVEAYEDLEYLSDDAAGILADTYKGKKIKVLVTPLLYENRQFLRIGRLIADRLEDQLVGASKFDLIGELDLQALMIKLKLSPGPGLFSPDNIGIIGGAAGADALVVGNITDMGAYFAVSIRLLKVADGTVLTAVQLNLVNKAGNLVNQFSEDEAVPAYQGRYRHIFVGRWERFGDPFTGLTVDVDQDDNSNFYAIINTVPYSAVQAGFSSGEVKWQKLRPVGWNVFEGESIGAQPGVYRNDGGPDNPTTPLTTVPIRICVDGSGDLLTVEVHTNDPKLAAPAQTWRRLY